MTESETMILTLREIIEGMTFTRMTVLSNSTLPNNNYSYSFYLYSIQVD